MTIDYNLGGTAVFIWPFPDLRTLSEASTGVYLYGLSRMCVKKYVPNHQRIRVDSIQKK